MTGKSLIASEDGIELAKVSLIDKFITQKRLADALQISRQPVSRFFNRKPISKEIFVRICGKLHLDWKEICYIPNKEFNDHVISQSDIEIILQEVRNKIKPKIQKQCGSMRVLDMTQPIGICDIYTDVNILESITGRQRKRIEDLMKNFNSEIENFERIGLGNITEKRVEGTDVVNRYPKLMILGKPGAGKSTFLKHLAIQCILGDFQVGRIPVFITLKEFAESTNKPTLFEHIINPFSPYDVNKAQLKILLENGCFLILLDGLDEVREEDSDYIIREIQSFSEQYFFSKEFNFDQSNFIETRLRKLEKLDRSRSQKRNEFKIQLEEKKIDPVRYESLFNRSMEEFSNEEDKIKNQYPDLRRHFDQGLSFLSNRDPHKIYSNCFLVTCRIAARDYVFQNFVEVEVADFDDKQISTFSNNWFNLKDPLKSAKFLRKLSENSPLKELANSPLLLTLLCLVFEESSDFPSNRSELYKEGVSILLKKWDAQRNIDRDQVYKNLSAPRKEDLLSLIALNTFQFKNYFFKQREVENHIVSYIRNLHDAKTDPNALQLDGEAVLKSIEAQHGLIVERAKGIYSFSHLTFQEYFTARKVTTTSDPQELENALNDLSSHITEKRWREVLLLALGMLTNAERLVKLSKYHVDKILASDKKLEEFLLWVQEKSSEFSAYRPESIRCLYFVIGCDLTRDLPKNRLPVISSESDLDRITSLLSTLDNMLVEDLASSKLSTYPMFRDFVFIRDLERNLSLDTARNLSSMLIRRDKKLLGKAIELLPDFTSKREIIDTWWSENSNEWTITFRGLLQEKYNIGYDWNFNPHQRSILKKYYNANIMIMECLNSDCYLTVELREEIKKNLFAPHSASA